MFVNSNTIQIEDSIFPISEELRNEFVRMLEKMALNGNKVVGYAKLLLPHNYD